MNVGKKFANHPNTIAPRWAKFRIALNCSSVRLNIYVFYGNCFDIVALLCVSFLFGIFMKVFALV